MTSASPPAGEHTHSWQPNGTVVEDRLLLSPDDVIAALSLEHPEAT